MGLRNFLWRRVGAYPATIRGERFVCHPLHRGRWRNMARDKWEPQTLDILDAHLSPQDVMWDVGAFIGQVALYASRKCKRVVCFEPNADSLRHLLWNLARNRADNVAAVGAALGAEGGFRAMGSFWGEQEESGVLSGLATSFYAPPSGRAATTPCLGKETWGPWLRDDPPDFVKMDVEGGEFELLPAMAGWLAERRPKLLLSLHGIPLRAAGRMSDAEMKKALEESQSVLSFYGEFLELGSGETFPVSELARRMADDNAAWADGVFLK